MANLVIFPDQTAFERALGLLVKAGSMLEVLRTPTFCVGLMAPAIVASNTAPQLAAGLEAAGIPFSGMLPYFPTKKDIPEAAPPDPLWRKILGDLRITSVRPSLSDPLRLRVEAIPERSLGPLIPDMARMIRGGAYCPDVPVLTFEEDHRLLAFSARSLVISRADHLLDAQIMLRCAIRLICSAWQAQSLLKPDEAPRQGIGAIEIFKRLPATDCGQCGHSSCMEFARCVFTGRTAKERCLPLTEAEYAAHRESLLWLLQSIGLLKERACSSGELSPAIGRVSFQQPSRGHSD
jgi:ArsR family metal-binding transcriptional regulator